MHSPLLLPGGSDGKASVYNAGDLGSIPGPGSIPWRRKWQPTPVLLSRKSHGWRSLVQATVHGVAKSWTQLSDFTYLLTLEQMKSCCLWPPPHPPWFSDFVSVSFVNIFMDLSFYDFMYTHRHMENRHHFACLHFSYSETLFYNALFTQSIWVLYMSAYI